MTMLPPKKKPIIPDKIKRPGEVPAEVIKVTVGCGNLYVIVSRNWGKMFEVFATLGKTGQCVSSQMSTLTTMITMGLRHHVPAEVLYSKLVGTRCPTPTVTKGVEYLSCGDAIGQVMKAEQEKIEKGFYTEVDKIYYERKAEEATGERELS